jgi:di/tricarboxylate transporter
MWIEAIFGHFGYGHERTPIVSWYHARGNTKIVGGFMAVTAFLSRWVSNTVYAAMMVPIALSVVDLAWRTRTGAGLKESGGILQDGIPTRHFATGLLPCIAYAASGGGLVTLIGSPPQRMGGRGPDAKCT